MKKTSFLYSVCLALMFAFCFAGCNNDDSLHWYDNLEDGTPFLSGNSLDFYYVDESGKDLIDINDTSTYPVTTVSDEKPSAVSEQLKNGQYEQRKSTIRYNRSDFPSSGGWLNRLQTTPGELTSFFTFALGDARKSTNRFYVWFKGKADVMDITCIYQRTDKPVFDGRMFGVSIIEWKVNGTTVWKTGNTNIRKSVFLVKKKDGSTEIKFKQN